MMHQPLEITPGRNRLLGALTADDFNLLRPGLQPVTLDFRQVLEKPHAPIEYVYFLTDGLASVIATFRRERHIEVGVIGREGLTGTAIILGSDRSPNETIIQIAGSGLRIAADELRRAMERSASLRDVLLRFTQVFMTQTAHTALANGRARIQERLARWLLMSSDRLDGEDLPLTHEFLAVMLGVRRPGVTVMIHVLEGKGLIKSTRGRLRIVDREGLEAVADGCYGVPEAEYRRLIGPV